MHASINHLDEPATMRLHTDEAARQAYRELFAKLAGMGADGAKLVASDASRHNLFAKLPVRNPLQPTIEWDKHQPPETWIELLERRASPTRGCAGRRRIRCGARAGVLLGNRMAAWFTEGAFCLTMTLRR